MSPYAQGVRVLHLSWEYPPLVYGGLGRHVHALAEAQAARGDDVTVITQMAPGEATDAVVAGVRVLRVPHDPPLVPFDEQLLAWVMGLETSMIRAGLELEREPDVIHAHDWIVSHAAVTLRTAFRSAALVSTIHATEAGRHQGWLPGSLSEAIHSTEHWLVHESDRVIVCSHHMYAEVEKLFAEGSLNPDHVHVIANGIDLSRWRATRGEIATARDRYGAAGPLIVFIGRLEWEKGVHTLIDALPRLRRRLPGLRVVIAGRGGATDELHRLARERRVANIIEFTGWMPERELNALIAAADALVIPSIYEPFGLVALEGAALGAPLVVARTGGLAEFVEDGVTGRIFEPGDVADLARAATSAVREATDSLTMARTARARLESSYRWELLAAQTKNTYADARARHDRLTAPPVWIPPRGVNLLRA
jgi:glycogen(starch) synthase